MAEAKRTPQPYEVIDYQHYPTLLKTVFALGENAGYRFVSKIPGNSAVEGKRVQIYVPDIRPIMDAVVLSAENDLPNEAVRGVLEANGIQTASIDWVTVNQWRSQVVLPFYPLVERELAFRAAELTDVSMVSFMRKRNGELEAAHAHFFTPGMFASLVDAADASRWGVSFPTRAALYAYARYMSGFNHQLGLEMSGQGSGVARTFFHYVENWPFIFREERPPKTPAENQASLDYARTGLPENLKPDYDFKGVLNTRSQTHGRGLPGRNSQQPDPPSSSAKQ